MKLKIPEGTRIVTAYGCALSGPGWRNKPLWIILRDKDGRLSEMCMQPKEFTEWIMSLYPIQEAVNSELLFALHEAMK